MQLIVLIYISIKQYVYVGRYILFQTNLIVITPKTYIFKSLFLFIWVALQFIIHIDRKKYERRKHTHTIMKAFSDTFLNVRFPLVDRWIDIEYVRVSGSPAQNVSRIQGTRASFH